MLSHLVSHVSPNAKAKIFCSAMKSARKKISLELGRPVISAESKEKVIHFLERPDIVNLEELEYCKPGRADTVY